MTADAPDAGPGFSADLALRLGDHSGRALAAKSHWGRTVVNEIKSGRRRPTDRQLRDMLRAAGADVHEIEHWSLRLRELDSPRAGSAVDPAADGQPSQQEPPRRRRPLLIATIAITGFLVIGIVIALNLLNRGDDSTAPQPPSFSPTQAASTPPTSTTGPSGGPAGSITLPQAETNVSSKQGVVLSGIASDDGTGTFWLLDHDSEGAYTADTSISLGAGGAWSSTDAPIGDASDVGKRLTILLVRADDTCGSFLRKQASADNTTFAKIPSGCVVLDSVPVNIARP